MSPSRKRYSREFKLELVRRIQETGRSQARMAEELGISANTISPWMRQFRNGQEDAFPGQGWPNSKDALVSHAFVVRMNGCSRNGIFQKNGKLLRCQNEPDTD